MKTIPVGDTLRKFSLVGQNRSIRINLALLNYNCDEIDKRRTISVVSTRKDDDAVDRSISYKDKYSFYKKNGCRIIELLLIIGNKFLYCYKFQIVLFKYYFNH